jgi:hypothetical protein
MKKYNVALFSFVLILIVLSCGRSTKQDEGLNYAIVHNQKPDFDSLYYQIDIGFPVFLPDDTTSNAFDVLNDAMSSFLDTAAFYYWGVDTEGAKSIIDDTKTHGVFMFYNSYQLTDTTNALVSVVFESYSYALGAHGFTAITTFNYDIANRRLLDLTDMIDISSEEKLAVLNGLLIENFENPFGCFTKEPSVDGEFIRFGMEPGFLVFHYEAYELGAYSCGEAVVKIPVDALREAGIWIYN